MAPEGYVDYKRRELCEDIACPVQVQLSTIEEGSSAYEETHKKCSTFCPYTTWQFHHWLIEKGYLIVKPKEK